MRKLIMMMTAVVVALALPACSDKEDEPTVVEPEQPEQEAPAYPEDDLMAGYLGWSNVEGVVSYDAAVEARVIRPTKLGPWQIADEEADNYLMIVDDQLKFAQPGETVKLSFVRRAMSRQTNGHTYYNVYLSQKVLDENPGAVVCDPFKSFRCTQGIVKYDENIGRNVIFPIPIYEQDMMFDNTARFVLVYPDTVDYLEANSLVFITYRPIDTIGEYNGYRYRSCEISTKDLNGNVLMNRSK